MGNSIKTIKYENANTFLSDFEKGILALQTSVINCKSLSHFKITIDAISHKFYVYIDDKYVIKFDSTINICDTDILYNKMYICISKW